MHDIWLHFQIETLPHPPKSPDLNPIENVWGLMVDEMAEELRHSARRLNAHDLWRNIQRKFEALRNRPGYFTRLADSMTSRLREVIDAEGSWTQY